VAKAHATVLAFYQTPETAQQALRLVGRAGFRRAAAILHLQPGRIAVQDNDVSPPIGALFGGAAALGALIGYVAFSRSLRIAGGEVGVVWWTVALLLTAVGAGLGYLLARLVDFGVDELALARFKRLVMPQEILVVVQTPPARGPEVLALLRRGEGAEPATFVLRPPPRVGPEAAGPEDVSRRERSTDEQLGREAARLAATQTLAPGRSRGHPLWARLRASERTIRAITAGLSDAVRLEQSISLAAEWLLDNAYIVRRHVGDVRRNLSRSFYDVLPILEGGDFAGQPRIYELSYDLASRTDAEVP
jgi:hypothetical protein